MEKLLLMLFSIVMACGLMACSSETGVSAPLTEDTVQAVAEETPTPTIFAVTGTEDSVVVNVKLTGILFDNPEDFDETRLKSYVNGERITYSDYDPSGGTMLYLHTYFYKDTDSTSFYTTNRNDQRGSYTYDFKKLLSGDEILIDGYGEFYTAKVTVCSADYKDTVVVSEYFAEDETEFKLRFNPSLSGSFKLGLEYY